MRADGGRLRRNENRISRDLRLAVIIPAIFLRPGFRNNSACGAIDQVIGVDRYVKSALHYTTSSSVPSIGRIKQTIQVLFSPDVTIRNMESRTTKTTKTRKAVTESAAAAAPEAANPQDTAKPRTKSASRKVTSEAAPAAKSHRRASIQASEEALVPAVAQPISAAPVPAATPRTVTHQAVATLAYSYWLSRNCQGGSPEDDWLRAETALLAR